MVKLHSNSTHRTNFSAERTKKHVYLRIPGNQFFHVWFAFAFVFNCEGTLWTPPLATDPFIVPSFTWPFIWAVAPKLVTGCFLESFPFIPLAFTFPWCLFLELFVARSRLRLAVIFLFFPPEIISELECKPANESDLLRVSFVFFNKSVEELLWWEYGANKRPATEPSLRNGSSDSADDCLADELPPYDDCFWCFFFLFLFGQSKSIFWKKIRII